MIKMENQDCFDFLSTIEDNTVDLFLIDPPYEISRNTNFSSGKPTGRDVDRFRVSMDFGNWDKGFGGIDIICKEAYRVLRKGGTFISFYDIWKITDMKQCLESARFKQLRFIEWVKTNPVPINSKLNYLTNAREIAVTAVKGSKPIFNSEYDRGIYSYPICHTKDRCHPTQKPEQLITDLIIKHSNEEDLVLDCFMGSGTTALSCVKNNRNFIGCEVDKDYYDASVKRLERLMLEL